ncbi:MAG: translocation/assembly module TamB domain-containing protein [Candidatus Comchoanobacterales bacterium]
MQLFKSLLSYFILPIMLVIFLISTQTGLIISSWVYGQITGVTIEQPTGRIIDGHLHAKSIHFKHVSIQDVSVDWGWSWSGVYLKSFNSKKSSIGIKTLFPSININAADLFSKHLGSIELNNIKISNEVDGCYDLSLFLNQHFSHWKIYTQPNNGIKDQPKNIDGNIFIDQENHQLSIHSEHLNIHMTIDYSGQKLPLINGYVYSHHTFSLSPDIRIDQLMIQATNDKALIEISGQYKQKPVSLSLHTNTANNELWRVDGKAEILNHLISLNGQYSEPYTNMNLDISPIHESGVQATFNLAGNPKTSLMIDYKIHIDQIDSVTNINIQGQTDLIKQKISSAISLTDHTKNTFTGKINGSYEHLLWEIQDQSDSLLIAAESDGLSRFRLNQFKYFYNEHQWTLKQPIWLHYVNDTVSLEQATMTNELNHHIEIQKASLNHSLEWSVNASKIDLPYCLIPQNWLSLNAVFNPFDSIIQGEFQASGHGINIDESNFNFDIEVMSGGVYDLVMAAPIDIDIFITEPSHIHVQNTTDTVNIQGVLNTNIGNINLDGQSTHLGHHQETNIHLSNDGLLHSQHEQHDLVFQGKVDLDFIDDYASNILVDINVLSGEYEFYLPEYTDLIEDYCQNCPLPPLIHVNVSIEPNVKAKYVGIEGNAKGTLDILFKNNDTIINGHIDIDKPSATLFSRHALLDQVTIDFQNIHQWTDSLLYLSSSKKQINTNGSTDTLSAELSGTLDNLNFHLKSSGDQSPWDIANNIFSDTVKANIKSDEALIKLLTAVGVPHSLLSLIHSFAELENNLLIDTIQLSPKLTNQYGELIDQPNAIITLQKQLGNNLKLFYETNTSGEDNNIGLRLLLTDHSSFAITREQDRSLALQYLFSGSIH